MKPEVTAEKSRLQALAKFVSDHREVLLLLCVAVALWWPYADGRSTYAYAELLRDIAVTRELAAGHAVLLGPASSLGAFHFGPAYYYLLFPAAWLFGFAPYSLAVSSLVFSLATVLLTGIVCFEWFHSRRLSLGVMAMMVLSSIDLQLAKYASNPNFVPFFSVLFFLVLERLMSGSRRARNWILLGLSFGILVQLHAVPMVVFPAVLVVVWVKKWLRVSGRGFAWFSVSALATLSPYILFEVTHGFPDVTSLMAITHQPFSFLNYATHFLDYLAFLFAPVVSLHGFFNVFVYWGGGLIAGLALLAVGFFVVFRKDLRSERKKVASDQIRRSVKRVLGLWLAVPTVVLLAPVPGTQVLHIYYFLVLLPLAFIAYGYLLWKLWLNGWRRVTIYVVCSFLLLQIAQLILYHQVVGMVKIPVII